MVELRELADGLNCLCPMHVIVDTNGRILHCGTTLSKVVERAVTGRSFFEVFNLVKPRLVGSSDAFEELDGQSIVVDLAQEKAPQLKGLCARVGDIHVVDFSFGISVVEAVKLYGLTASDFSPTDQTMGMLYLFEAKSLALEEFKRLSSRLEGAKRVAEVEAHTDALTGLLNRRGLENALREALNRRDEFAVMQLDLDHFKAVNDGLGHAAGDEVLVHVGQILQKETRKHDLLCRNGGDEFTVVLTNISKRKVAEEIGNRIVAEIKKPMTLRSGSCRVSASLGTVLSGSRNASNVSDLLQEADKALYASKAAGRGRQTLVA